MKNLKHILVVVLCLTFVHGFAQEQNASEHTISTDSKTQDLSKDIHLVAKVSSNKVSVDDEINIEYRLYISQNVGVSRWELLEKPTYEGFNFENVKLENLKIENVTYKGESYRMVLVKKDILKATKSGDHKIKPLQLQIVAEVFGTDNVKDGFKLSKTQVTETLESNALKVNVKS